MRSSRDKPGRGSPAANVGQPVVEPDGVGDVEMSCGLAGRLIDPPANEHSIAGSGVGVAIGEPASAAVGAGAAGLAIAGRAGAGVAVTPPAAAGGGATVSAGVAAGRTSSGAAVGVGARCALSGVGVCHAAGVGLIEAVWEAAFGPQAATSQMHATATTRR